MILLSKPITVEQLFSVKTIEVKKEKMNQSIKNYGYVVVDQTNVYEIKPRFGGYVIKLYADNIYKKVKKGDPLVTVYSPEVFKAKEEYINTISYTKERSNKGMLESSKLKLKLLGIEDKEINELKMKDKASVNTTIYSPIDGYIFIKGINEGGAFKAKQELFQIVNLDNMWVEVKLFEDNRIKHSRVKNYELSFKGIKKIYKTNKKLLYPKLDPKVAALTLRLSVKNKDNQLFPGMYANVTSFLNESENITLPTTAVIRKDGKFYVFLVSKFKGIYEPVEVKVEIINSSTYSIISGVKHGDEVVNNALFMMDSDAQINALY